ncbi:hypothetical protein D3C85_980470 [compost metagenome]
MGDVVEFGLRPVHPGDQLVLAAEQGEGAADVEVGQPLAVVVLVQRRIAEQAEAAGGVRGAVDVEQTRVALLLHPGQHALGLPAVAQVVLQLDEGALLLVVPERPVGGGAGRAREVGGRAVAEVQRQGAPHRAVGGGLLQGVAQAQGGALGEVGLQHAVEHVLFPRIAIQIGVLVLVSVDQPATDVAGRGQRPGDVGVDASLVPGSGGQVDARLRGGGRPLAHEVDGRRGVAGAGHQAVGAAHHLDALEGRGVDAAVEVAVDEGGTDAVVLEVGDVEAARGEVGTVGLHFLDGDARGVLERIVDAGQLEVVELGAGDGGHRLRRLPRGQFQPGRRAARLGLVGIALGGGAVGLADDGRGVELQGLVRLGGVDGGQQAGVQGAGEGQGGLAEGHGKNSGSL